MCVQVQVHMCVCVLLSGACKCVTVCVFVCVLLKTCAACAGIIFSSLAAHFLLKRVCQRDCMLALSALTHSLHLSLSHSHRLSFGIFGWAALPCLGFAAAHTRVDIKQLLRRADAGGEGGLLCMHSGMRKYSRGHNNMYAELWYGGENTSLFCFLSIFNFIYKFQFILWLSQR